MDQSPTPVLPFQQLEGFGVFSDPLIMQSASCAAECVQRNPHRVSNHDRFRAKASRPDRLSVSPKHDDSLRAKEVPVFAGTCAATSCQFFSGAVPPKTSRSDRMIVTLLAAPLHPTLPADHTNIAFRLLQERCVRHSNDTSTL